MSLEWTDLVAAALLALLVVASAVVPIVFGTGGRRPLSAARRDRTGTITFAVVGVVAAGLALAGLPVPFFLGVVVLNIVFGAKENVPLSRFPMFSRPAIVQWYIRVEDQDGMLLSGPAFFGVPTALIMKRFNTEMKAADPRTSIHKATHQQRVEAAERVAEFMVGLLNRRPLVVARVSSIRLHYVEVIQGSDGLAVTSERLIERSP